MDTEASPQLLLKLKMNDYREPSTRPAQSDVTSTALDNGGYTNGHYDPSTTSAHQENQPAMQPHITNMLSSLNDDNQWNDQPLNSNHALQQTTTTR